jgi:biotin carboxylase
MHSTISNHKHLIILGAGPQQEKLYVLAKSLRHKIIGIDLNPDSISKKYCDQFFNISIKDDQEIIKILKSSGLEFSGVITCGAEVSPQISRIANEFGLVGIPYNVAINTTDKLCRSSALEKGGIKIPRFQSLKNTDDLNIPFPVVIKPADSSGSRGVALVRDKVDAINALNIAKEISPSNTVMCEEFIEDGTEVSIEAFIINGEPFITGIAERHFLDINQTHPDFIEYGGTMPPTFSEKLIHNCESVFKQAILALGIHEGPSKGDLIIKNDEVYVLEITSRTSPGFAAEMQPLNSGIRPLDILIKWATGQHISKEELIPKFNRGVAHRYFLHSPGKIKNIKGLDLLKSNEDVKYHLMLNTPKLGNYLEPISYMNRIFYIITEGQTNRDAVKKAESLLKKIIIRTEE